MPKKMSSDWKEGCELFPSLEPLPTICYKDTVHDVNGLMLRVTPKLKLTYVAHGWIKAEGKSAQFFNTGTAGEMLLEVARKPAAKYKSLMAEGLHPSKVQKRQERTYDLEEFYQSYIGRGLKNCSYRETINCIAVIIQLFLLSGKRRASIISNPFYTV